MPGVEMDYDCLSSANPMACTVARIWTIEGSDVSIYAARSLHFLKDDNLVQRNSRGEIHSSIRSPSS